MADNGFEAYYNSKTQAQPKQPLGTGSMSDGIAPSLGFATRNESTSSTNFPSSVAIGTEAPRAPSTDNGFEDYWNKHAPKSFGEKLGGAIGSAASAVGTEFMHTLGAPTTGELSQSVRANEALKAQGHATVQDAINALPDTWPNRLIKGFTNAGVEAAATPHMPDDVIADMEKNKNLTPFKQTWGEFGKNWQDVLRDSAWRMFDDAARTYEFAQFGISGALETGSGGAIEGLGAIGFRTPNEFMGIPEAPNMLGTNTNIPDRFNRAHAEGLTGPASNEAVAKTGTDLPFGTGKPDIHSVVRQRQGPLFEAWDQLHADQEKARGQLAAIRAAKGGDIQQEIDDILGKVKGVEGKLTKKAAARLDDLRDQLKVAKNTVSPEEQQIKEEHLNRFNQIQDLGPEVRAAYRIAAEENPEFQTHETPAITGNRIEEIKNASTINRVIADDVSKKLQATGKTKEEAENNGAVWQAVYENIAEQFKGKLGTAEDIYRKYGADIKSGIPQPRVKGGKTYGQEAQEKAPVFFSALSKGFENVKMLKAPAEKWINAVKKLGSDAGVKREEVEAVGLEDWLREQKGDISKADIQQFIDEHQIQVEEVHHSNDPLGVLTPEERSELENLKSRAYTTGNVRDYSRLSISEQNRFIDLQNKLTNINPVRHGQYALPGGKDQRELILTLPTKDSENIVTSKLTPNELQEFDRLHAQYMEFGGTTADHMGPEAFARYEQLKNRYNGLPSTGSNIFTTSHWPGIRNPLAHVRFDTRFGPNGEKILHISEIQSDWHQKGAAEGYTLSDQEYDHFQKLQDINPAKRTKEENDQIQSYNNRYYIGIPNAPFKSSWHELALKRMLRYAVDNGYDKVSFDTGTTVATRFNVLKHVDAIKVINNPGSVKPNVYYRAKGSDGAFTRLTFLDQKDLENHISKELAAKITEDIKNHTGDKPFEKDYTGLNTQLGGKFHKDIYDRRIPDFLNKYTKKWGGKVVDDKLESSRTEGHFSVVGQDGLVDGPFNTRAEAEQFAQQQHRDNPEADMSTIRQEPGIESQPAASIHSLELTPELKDAVSEGQPLFQKGKDEVKGSFTIQGDRGLVQMFKGADASTFLHESGHKFLDLIRNLSQHPDAPDELKNDVKMVEEELDKALDHPSNKKDLKKQITKLRKANPDWENHKLQEEAETVVKHEQFAKWLEQYFRAGIAPTRELAEVFAKFKEWLSQLYQTVTALGAPITPPIKDFFDRILTTESQSTVIAPGEALQEPQERGLEGSQYEDSTASPISRVEPSESQTEASGTKETPTLGEQLSKPILDLPKGPLLKRQLKDIIEGGPLQDYLGQFITLNNETLEARKGKVSDQDQINYAEALGQLPKDIKIAGLKSFFINQDIPLGSKIYAAGHAVIEMTKAVSEAADKDDQDSFVLHSKLLLDSLEAFAKGRADVGRAMRAFQILYKEAKTAGLESEFLKEQTGQTFLQVKQQMARFRELIRKGATPSQAIKQLRYEHNAGWGRWIVEYLKCNWLTGPYTHIIYEIANQGFTLWRTLPVSAIQGAISHIQAGLSADPIEQRYMWEAVAGTHAYLRGQLTGIKALGQSLLTGDTKGIPLNVLAKQRAQYEVDNKFLPQAQYDARVKQLITNPTDEMRELAVSPQNMFLAPKAIPNLPYFPIGSVARAGAERVVAPVHSWSYTVALQVNLEQLFCRQALNEGLSGQAYYKRVAELKYEPPMRLVEEASKLAREQSLMSRSGNLSKRITGVAQWEINEDATRPKWNPKNPIGSAIRQSTYFGPAQPLQIIAPFIGVNANIVRLALTDASPFGFAFKSFRNDFMGRNGTVAQATAIGKMTAGLTALGAWWALKAFGHMTPAPAADKRTQAVQRMRYGHPNSLIVGDHSIDLSRLGVLGMGGVLASDLYDFTAQGGFEPWNTDDFSHAATNLTYSMGQDFIHEGALSGFADALDAIDDPKGKGETWVNRTIASAVPFAVGTAQISHSGGFGAPDPYMKQAHGLIETIKANTPYLAEDLANKIDIFGNRIPNKELWGTYVYQVNNDPVMLMLDQLQQQTGYFPAACKDTIQGVKLNEKQYEMYQVYAGQAMYDALSRLRQLPNWDQLTPQSRLIQVKNAVTTSREIGRNHTYVNDSTILQQQLDNLRQILRINQ